MKKLIVISLIFEMLAIGGIALLIYTAEPADSAGTMRPTPGSQYSAQEDVVRTAHRLDAALDKVRWGIVTMLIISIVSQAAFLAFEQKRASRTRSETKSD